MVRIKKAFTSIVSILLVIVLMFTGCVFASSVKPGLAPSLKQTYQILGLQDAYSNDLFAVETSTADYGHGITVTISELSNGEFAIWEYYKGDLIVISLLDRTSGVLHQIDYRSNKGLVELDIASIATIEISDNTARDDLVMNRDYSTNVSGSIKYRTYDNWDSFYLGDVTIKVNGAMTLTSQQINITGFFENATQLVSAILTLIAWPLAAVNPIASLMMQLFADALGYVVFDHKVFNCDVTSVSWTGRNQSGTVILGGINGKKYTCVDSGAYYNKTVYTGNYYAINSLENHVYNFGVQMYINCYNNDTSGIPYSWTYDY